jgi:quercetin dioxygenase-like cupin family protein
LTESGRYTASAFTKYLMNKEIIRAGQISVRFLVESLDSNGSVAIFEFMVPAGAKVPLPHYHKEFDETIYGVEGVLTFTVDGKAIEVGPSDSCFIPRGAVHGFTNLKQADSKMLAIVTPALIGPDYFKEMADLVSAGGPPDVEKMKAVMTKHGLVPVMPQR